MTRGSRSRFAAAIITVVLALTGVIADGSAAPADAADTSLFRPGHIVSDSVFYNSGTMTEAQIQAFLLSKVPNCYPGASCLTNTTQTTWTRPANPMCSQYDGAADEPVARIIYKVAVACGINPQALIVMLQKEQGLVTNSYPSMWSWKAAMGYACPDTAPCDSEFAWFYNQVYKAAWQLRRYENPPGTSLAFTRYTPGTTAQVYWHPNLSGCGSGPVYIENRATAALYYYTPYQPNGAALAAGYAASSNPCSSYGNRNFFNYFSDWFGSPVSLGPYYIDQKHAALGGTAGTLGDPLSGYVDIVGNGAGVGRAYEGGSIYWTAPYGVWYVHGTFRDYYFEWSGALGRLGWPASDRVTINANGGGEGQAFQFGSIYAKTGGQPYAVSGAIRGRYWQLGGSAGGLGWPTSESGPLTGTTGMHQQFEGGTIVSSAEGTALLGTEIGPYWTSNNGPTVLGWPQTDPIPIAANGGGFGQVFQRGSVYSSASGTWAVSGGVRETYFALGGSAGSLGWPTADAVCSDASTCSQAFQGGTIYRTATGARVGLPAIETYAAAHPGIGARISALIPIPANGSGYGQVFQHASVYSSAAGTWAVSGGVREAYFSLGGAAGSLGWPTADAVCSDASTCSQAFAGGTIYWTATSGGRVGLPAIEAYAAAHPDLGARASGLIVIAANGGGYGQVFQRASVYSSAAGTWAVSGGVRETYFTLGGSAGSLGWPTAEAVCSDASTCSQSFQAGTIYWTAAAGGKVG